MKTTTSNLMAHHPTGGGLSPRGGAGGSPHNSQTGSSVIKATTEVIRRIKRRGEPSIALSTDQYVLSTRRPSSSRRDKDTRTSSRRHHRHKHNVEEEEEEEEDYEKEKIGGKNKNSRESGGHGKKNESRGGSSGSEKGGSGDTDDYSSTSESDSPTGSSDEDDATTSNSIYTEISSSSEDEDEEEDQGWRDPSWVVDEWEVEQRRKWEARRVQNQEEREGARQKKLEKLVQEEQDRARKKKQVEEEVEEVVVRKEQVKKKKEQEHQEQEQEEHQEMNEEGEGLYEQTIDVHPMGNGIVVQRQERRLSSLKLTTKAGNSSTERDPSDDDDSDPGEKKKERKIKMAEVKDRQKQKQQQQQPKPRMAITAPADLKQEIRAQRAQELKEQTNGAASDPEKRRKSYSARGRSASQETGLTHRLLVRSELEQNNNYNHKAVLPAHPEPVRTKPRGQRMSRRTLSNVDAIIAEEAATNRRISTGSGDILPPMPTNSATSLPHSQTTSPKKPRVPRLNIAGGNGAVSQPSISPRASPQRSPRTSPDSSSLTWNTIWGRNRTSPGRLASEAQTILNRQEELIEMQKMARCQQRRRSEDLGGGRTSPSLGYAIPSIGSGYGLPSLDDGLKLRELEQKHRARDKERMELLKKKWEQEKEEWRRDRKNWEKERKEMKTMIEQLKKSVKSSTPEPSPKDKKKNKKQKQKGEDKDTAKATAQDKTASCDQCGKLALEIRELKKEVKRLQFMYHEASDRLTEGRTSPSGKLMMAYRSPPPARANVDPELKQPQSPLRHRLKETPSLVFSDVPAKSG